MFELFHGEYMLLSKAEYDRLLSEADTEIEADFIAVDDDYLSLLLSCDLLERELTAANAKCAELTHQVARHDAMAEMAMRSAAV